MKNTFLIIACFLSLISFSQSVSQERIIVPATSLAASVVDSVYIQQNPILSSQTVEQVYTTSQAHRFHLVPASGDPQQKSKAEDLNALPASATPQQLYLEPQSSKLHLVPLEEKKDPK